MTFSKIFLTTAALSTVALAGCGSMDTKAKDSKDSKGGVAPELVGTWKTACIEADFLGMNKKTDAVDYNAAGQFNHVTTLASDDSCGSAALVLGVSGNFEVTGDDAHVDGGAKDINYTIHGASLTPYSDGAVKALTLASYCGVTDWSAGKAVDIASRDCLGEKLESGQALFDIYRLSDDKALLLGDAMVWFDKSDSKDRPTKIATDRPYLKQ